MGDASRINIRYGYNLAAMSFTPEEIYKEILAYYPSLISVMKPDFRQELCHPGPKVLMIRRQEKIGLERGL